eukprot:gene5883-11333_t
MAPSRGGAARLGVKPLPRRHTRARRALCRKKEWKAAR